MGMYDGLDGTDTASTAHVMRILGAKGVLVVDVRGMSRSAHALVAGFSGFDPAVALAGVIFNRVGSPRHRAMIEDHLAAPALGWIPRDPSLAVESRHLGLQMAFEIDPATPGLELVGESCDLEGILGAAVRTFLLYTGTTAARVPARGQDWGGTGCCVLFLLPGQPRPAPGCRSDAGPVLSLC
jgi:cobyrinic acid a,c-diamide synthase